MSMAEIFGPKFKGFEELIHKDDPGSKRLVQKMIQEAEHQLDIFREEIEKVKEKIKRKES